MKDNYDIKNLNPRKNPYVDRLANNYLEYKGYRTYMKYDATDNILVGELIGIDDIVAFHGTSIDEFTDVFHRSVDDYIDTCQGMCKDMRPEYNFNDAVNNPYVVKETNTIIRAVSADDYELVGKIYNQAFKHNELMLKYYEGLKEYVEFSAKQGYAFILEVDDVPCATLLAYERPDLFTGISLFVELLAVIPDYQNKGFGHQLMDKIEVVANEKGIKEISLSTACYLPAYQFYQSLGFKDIKADHRTLIKSLENKDEGMVVPLFTISVD